MKQATFLEGVGIALAASVTGSILFTALTPLFASGAVLRLLIAALAFAYVLYLLQRSRERIGRVTVIGVWLLAAVLLWLWQPGLLLYLLLHLGMVWLVRALYFYSSALSALADLGLNGLALAAAVWAASHTGSLLLSIWCFFLLQAAFVAIPATPRRGGPSHSGPNESDDFQRAHHVAETALRKLSSTH